MNFDDFNKEYNSDNHNYLICTKVIPSDLYTPVSVMLKLRNDFSESFLYESADGDKTKGRYSIIGLGSILKWIVVDNLITIEDKISGVNREFGTREVNPFTVLNNLIRDNKIYRMEQVPFMASGFFGYIGYEMMQFIEKIPVVKEDETNIPDAIMFLPEMLLIFDHLKDVLYINKIIKYSKTITAEDCYNAALSSIDLIIDKIITHDNTPSVYANLTDDNIEFVSNFTKQEYCDTVEKAREHIKNGEIFQILPSQRFTANFNADPFSFYRSLRNINPSPFLFYMKIADFYLVGSSPEIMVRVRSDKVTIRPLAGTRKRGKNEQEDELIKKELLQDSKEIAEHLMLIDLGRNDVGTVAEQGTVTLLKKMEVEFYSHVMHIASTVEGILQKDKTTLDAVLAGFPAGTVVGAPKIRAMEIISQLEKVKRSFYSGSLGYITQENADMCIILRTALIKDDKIYLQSGGGVVYDSNPLDEYNESLNKAKALMEAANRVQLYRS